MKNHFQITGELLQEDASSIDAKGKDFGIVFSLIAIIFYALRLYRGKGEGVLSVILLGLGGILLLVALFAPRALFAPAKLWQYFGEGLGKVMSKVIVTITFVVVILPVALLLKILGKDLLLMRKTAADSYWIPITSKKPKESYLNPF
jgi:hypothetical protein